MFVDARRVEAGSVVSVDLCVIGSGPAGLTVVKELADTGLSIAVLESGDLEADPEAQALASGENIGRTYFDLDVTRLRFFGGSSNHWGGRCVPLAPHDFMERPWIPHSGWPLTRSDLDPYYERAHAIIGIGKFDYDAPRLAKTMGERLFPFDPALIQSIWTRVHPLNFGESMRAAVDASTNIRCFLQAHALELETDEAGSTVERVLVGTLAGNRFSIEAKKFIVACGGLENPRLLKLSTNGGKRPAGIGNDHDLVGRFFMEHLLHDSGFLAMNERKNIYRIYDEFLPYENFEVQATIALNPNVLEKEKISNVYFEFQLRHGFGLSPSVSYAMYLFKSFEHLHWPRDFVERASDFLTDIDTMIDVGAKIIAGKPILYDQEPIYLRTYYYSEQVPKSQ
jgi:choline dehydrogenase-like flavoprotein